QDRAEIMDLEIVDAQDVRVVEALQQPELALRGPLHVGALLLTGGTGDQILPGSSFQPCDGDVAGDAVLVSGVVGQQLAQEVVAGAAFLLGAANAGLLHRPGQGAGQPGVDLGPANGVDTPDLTVQQPGNDAGARPERVVVGTIDQA